MTDPNTERTDESRDYNQSKVARVIEEYDLNGLGETLENRWTSTNGERVSLRELADLFNRRVLHSALKDVGANPLDGEVKNTYRLLTDDDISAGVRTRAKASLQQDGIDIERLLEDFVSHQAVHTYLTQYREVEQPSRAQSPEHQIEKGLETIQRLKSRLQAVTEKTLRTFSTTNRITLGTFSVIVDVRVFCEDCRTQYDVGELFEQQGCECEQRGP